MNHELPQHDVVLLGAGHTHLHVIRMWRMHARANTRLTCVTNQPQATYSGMLSGVLAGDYPQERMEIDLVRLCASCNVRLIHAEATGFDAEKKQLQFDCRPPVRFDVLSIGIGSKQMQTSASCQGLAIKPLQTFLDRLSQRIQELTGQPLYLVVVGGGAAGVELACCLPRFVAKHARSATTLSVSLIEQGGQILSGMPQQSQRLAQRHLAENDVTVHLNSTVHQLKEDQIELAGGEQLPANLVVFATSAVGPTLLGGFGLPLDDLGFLLTRDTLQSIGNDSVFVVGDSGTQEQSRQLPKSGVHAVRQGPVLWENIHRRLNGQSLTTWRPQRSFLTLLNTGDQRALATYKGASFHSRWCWRLKDFIDSRFMSKYQDYPAPGPMTPAPQLAANTSEPMPCGGCGCKVSPGVLTDSLAELQQQESPHVLLGLDTPDDAALLHKGPGNAIAVTTDFFKSFVDDPYLLGRVAALNAMNDLHVKGVEPRSALTLAIVPRGPAHQQRQLLDELLAGALREFSRHKVAIVGGHTIEGPELTFGFTVLGDAHDDRVIRIATPNPGDKLVLTKPLGTGVLLAAHMRASCQAEWWESLVESMLADNSVAARAALELGATAATDVSGFGLAGHLCEMLGPRNISAELNLPALPLLPGTLELLEQGVESTITPSNRDNVVRQDPAIAESRSAKTPILFDPQTSGGLLVAISPQNAPKLLEACGKSASEIGVVRNRSPDGRILLLQE